MFIIIYITIIINIKIVIFKSSSFPWGVFCVIDYPKLGKISV